MKKKAGLKITNKFQELLPKNPFLSERFCWLLFFCILKKVCFI